MESMASALSVAAHLHPADGVDRFLDGVGHVAGDVGHVHRLDQRRQLQPVDDLAHGLGGDGGGGRHGRPLLHGQLQALQIPQPCGAVFRGLHTVGALLPAFIAEGAHHPAAAGGNLLPQFAAPLRVLDNGVLLLLQ